MLIDTKRVKLPAEGEEMFGNSLDYTVHWKGRSDVARLQGRPLRIRFVLRDADLYSYRFEGK